MPSNITWQYICLTQPQWVIRWHIFTSGGYVARILTSLYHIQYHLPLPTIYIPQTVDHCSIFHLTQIPWWRHQMKTFSALLAICAGNSPVPGEFPAQRPLTRSFDVYFDLSLNKRLSKQWRGWWFETQSRSLWRHRNATQSLRNQYTNYQIHRTACTLLGWFVLIHFLCGPYCRE